MANELDQVKKVEPKKVLTPREKAQYLNGRMKVDVIKQYGLDGENFHYHWANAEGEGGSNVEMYMNVGYDKCLDKSKVLITRKGQNLGITQILMRIPIKEYEAIQYHKLDEAREIDRDIGRKNIPNLKASEMYGEVRTTSEIVK
jgi:hypothetical protein